MSPSDSSCTRRYTRTSSSVWRRSGARTSTKHGKANCVQHSPTCGDSPMNGIAPTDEQIARRLRLIVTVRTEALSVPNEIIEVGDNSVTVRSERTGTPRTVPFRDLRNAESVTTHGQIVRTLAV